jgi:hypothetical protein
MNLSSRVSPLPGLEELPRDSFCFCQHNAVHGLVQRLEGHDPPNKSNKGWTDQADGLKTGTIFCSSTACSESQNETRVSFRNGIAEFRLEERDLSPGSSTAHGCLFADGLLQGCSRVRFFPPADVVALELAIECGSADAQHSSSQGFVAFDLREDTLNGGTFDILEIGSPGERF